jgi:hypothetical protein
MTVCLIMQLSLMVTHKHVQQLWITVFSNVISCSLLPVYMMVSQMETPEVTQKLKLYCTRPKAKQAISLS